METDGHQVKIDFLLELQNDPAQIKKIASQIQNGLKDINPDIDLDNDEVVEAVSEIIDILNKADKEAGELGDILKELEVELDNESAKKSLQEIYDQIENFENIDLAELDKALEGVSVEDIEKIRDALQEGFENFDASKYKKEVKELAEEFSKAERETQELYEAQKKALAQMKLSGKQGSDEYEKLQSEIIDTEKKVQEFKDALEDLNEVEMTGNETFVDLAAKFEALGSLGEQFSSFASQGQDANEQLRIMRARTGATADEMERLHSAAVGAFKKGIGESLADAINSVGVTDQILGQFLDSDEIEDFTVKAGGIAKTFEKDINEVIVGSRTFISQFGLEGQEALDLVAYGMQKTGGKMDDFLDSIDEYSVHMKDASYSAYDTISLYNKAMELGQRDTDKIGDTIKEMNIRIFERDVSKELEDSYGRIPETLYASLMDMTKQAESGIITTKELAQRAATEINNSFESSEIDETAVRKLTRTFGGTMAEDIGGEMWAKIFSYEPDMAELEQNAQAAGEVVTEAIAPRNAFEKITRSFEALSTKASQVFAPIIGGAGKALVSISQIAPAMSMINNVNFGQITSKLKGLSGSISKFLGSNNKLMSSLGQVSGKMKGLSSLAGKLGPALANPYVLAAAAIAGAFALFFTKTEKGQAHLEKFKGGAQELWDKLQPVFKGLGSIFEEGMDVIVTYGEILWEYWITPYEVLMEIVDTAIELITDMTGTTIEGANSFERLGSLLGMLGDGLGSVTGFLDNMLFSMKAAKEYLLAFIGSAPAIIGAFYEYARFKMNPANWVGGNKEKEQELKNNLVTAVNGAVAEANREVDELTIDKVIDQSFTIKEDIDKHNKIGELITRMKNAKTEAEKAEIGTELAKHLPDAAEGFRKIVDEQGNVIAVADINIAKAEEQYEAQKRLYDSGLTQNQENYLSILDRQSSAYAKTKTEAEELANQIVRLSGEGQDTSDLERKYAKLRREQEEYMKSYLDTMSKGKDAGYDMGKAHEVIAKNTKTSTEEAEAMVEVQKESIKKAEEQGDAVATLGEKWAEAKNKANETLNTNLTMMAALQDKRAKGAKLSEDEQKQMAELDKSLKQTVREVKNYDKRLESVKKQYGLIETKGKSSYEIAKEYFGIAKQQLDNDLKRFEIAQNSKILSENRQRTEEDDMILKQKQLENLEEQKQAMLDIYKQQGLISLDEEGEIVIHAKPAKKAEIESALLSMDSTIQSMQSDIQSVTIQARLEYEEAEKQLEELKFEQLSFEIEIGMKDETDMLDALKSKFAGVKQEFAGYALLQERGLLLTAEQKKKYAELSQQVMEMSKEIRTTEQTIYDKRLSDTREFNEARLSAVEAKYEEESERAEKFSSLISESYRTMYDSDSDDAVDAIERQESAKLAKLEEMLDQELISRESYEEKKLAIEQEGRRRRMEAEEEHQRKLRVLDKLNEGAAVEREREKEVEILEIKKENIESELDVYKDKYDLTEEKFSEILEAQRHYAELERQLQTDSNNELLQEQRDSALEILKEKRKGVSEEDFESMQGLMRSFDDTSRSLQEKTEELNIFFHDSGEAISDAAANILSGNPEQAKENMRDFLAMWAGQIQAKISGFVLDWVLSPSVTAYLNALPFPANLVAYPLAFKAIEAAVKRITTPMIQGMLSFASGGIVEKPTMFVAGDGSKLGGINREYILRQDQLIKTVQMGIAGYESVLAAKMDALARAFSELRLSTELHGRTIKIMLARQEAHDAKFEY